MDIHGPLRRLKVGRLQLSKGAMPTLATGPDEEAILHILTGTVSVEEDDGVRHMGLGGRRDVFERPPSAVTVGPGRSIRVWAESNWVDAFWVVAGPHPSSPATYAGEGKIVGEGRIEVVWSEDVPVHEIGESHYYRQVREVVGERSQMLGLRCGETINAPGKWSSWPHHEFDGKPDLASEFEETFTVFHKPLVPGMDGGETLLRRRGWFVDGSAVDDVRMLKNGETVVVPLGYHPICAPLTSQLCYVWFYLSPIPKRYATTADDGGYYAT